MALANGWRRSLQLSSLLQPAAGSAGILYRTSSTNIGGKIYEMRRYEVKPEKYTEFLNRGREKYEELMMPHGKLLGYWVASLGALNQVYHLWEYGEFIRMRLFSVGVDFISACATPFTESFAHRDEVVKAKRSDKKALEGYLNFALTCVVSQVCIAMVVILINNIIFYIKFLTFRIT